MKRLSKLFVAMKMIVFLAIINFFMMALFTGYLYQEKKSGLHESIDDKLLSNAIALQYHYGKHNDLYSLIAYAPRGLHVTV